MRWSALVTAALCLGLDSRWKWCDSFLVTCMPPRLKQLPGITTLNAALRPSTMMAQSRNKVVRGGGLEDPSTSHTIDGQDVAGVPQPVSGYMFVKPDTDATLSQTAGGIVLPEKSSSMDDAPIWGTVIAVGPGQHHPHTGVLIHMCVAPGDRVVYSKWAANTVKWDDQDHAFVTDDNLLFVQAVSHGSQEIALDNIKMIRDQVLVSIDERSEKFLDSGVVLTVQSAKKAQSTQGIVVALGPGRMTSNGNLSPMHVNVGDNINFREFAGIELVIERKRYAVVKMSDCLSKW